MDPRMSRWAKTLVNYCLDVKSGDTVQINATPVAEPLIAEVYREVLRAGGHPIPAIRVPGLIETLLREGNDAQLQWINPADRLLTEQVDCFLTILSETNTRQLAGVLLRAIGAATTHVLTAEDFARMPSSADRRRPDPCDTAMLDVNLFDDRGHVRSLLEIENEVIRLAHRRYEGRMAEIAHRLGIGRSTLYRKVAELGIECLRR